MPKNMMKKINIGVAKLSDKNRILMRQINRSRPMKKIARRGEKRKIVKFNSLPPEIKHQIIEIVGERQRRGRIIGSGVGFIGTAIVSFFFNPGTTGAVVGGASTAGTFYAGNKIKKSSEIVDLKTRKLERELNEPQNKELLDSFKEFKYIILDVEGNLVGTNKKPVLKKFGRKRMEKNFFSLNSFGRLLSGIKRKKAQRLLNLAYSIDIACSNFPRKILEQAKENPQKIFVGVDTQKISPKYRKLLRKQKNVFFIQADALEALELVEVNSKTKITMDNFPFLEFKNELPENIQYRKKLFQKSFRALKRGGKLIMVTNMDKAREELKEAGFRVSNELGILLKTASENTLRLISKHENPLNHGIEMEFNSDTTGKMYSAPFTIIATKP